MSVSRFERLIEINKQLGEIAVKTSDIAHSNASNTDKDRQIAPYMKLHEQLIDEAKKLFP